MTTVLTEMIAAIQGQRPDSYVIDAPKVVIRSKNDLQFTISAVVHGHYVDFTIYEIVAFDQGPDQEWNIPLWQRSGSDWSPDTVDNLDEAEPYIVGSVKWDGCSNWTFCDNARNVMVHGCSRTDLENIGRVLTACWDMTQELCANFDKTI